MSSIVIARVGLILCVACSALPKINVGNNPDGSVAGSGGASGSGGLGGFGGGDNTLNALITEPPSEIVIDVITISCAGECKQVLAIASGGNGPYTFAWNDGVTTAAREICATDDTTFTVTVNDTAIVDGEFPYAGQTAIAAVTAQVLICDSDAGVLGSTVYWTQWRVFSVGTPGTANGAITTPSGNIDVSFEGEVGSYTQNAGGATNNFLPESTYVSATVMNGPPTFGMVAVSGNAALTQTIRFSQPVRDPLIAIWSLGFGSLGLPMEIELGMDGALLSSGPGSYGLPGTITQTGRRFSATEGNGVVQVTGTFSAITFTVPTPEPSIGYAGFTVGVRQ